MRFALGGTSTWPAVQQQPLSNPIVRFTYSEEAPTRNGRGFFVIAIRGVGSTGIQVGKQTSALNQPLLIPQMHLRDAGPAAVHLTSCHPGGGVGVQQHVARAMVEEALRVGCMWFRP